MSSAIRAPTAASMVAERVDALTPRQRDVLRLVARGLANKEIGAALGISPETARTHLTQLMARLGVENRTAAAAAYLAYEAAPGRVKRVLDRPAVAVLPLLAPDPAAAEVAAGLGRDLADLFARWCYFPVIATASTIDARGLGATSAAIGAELGARFLIDGMLRRAGSTFRLSIQVIDAPTGQCVWTSARDFAAQALFEVQDEVCAEVVAAVYPRMVELALAPSPRPRPEPHEDLSAWELVHRALVWQGERERSANLRAQEALRAALDRDPRLTLAHFGLGLVAYDALLNQWAPIDAAQDRLARAAERCCELEPHLAEGYYLRGRHAQSRGDLDGAVASALEAVGRNPSFVLAHGFLGQVHLLTGRLDDGLARMEHVCRLSPRTMVTGLAVAHFARGDHREGLAAAEQAIARRPGYAFAYALAAACAFRLDDLEKAGRHARAMRAVHPSFGPASFARIFGAHVEAVSRLAGALEALDGACSS